MEQPDDRGSTEDWLLPEDRAVDPPGPGIEERVEEALATARDATRMATAAKSAARSSGEESKARVQELAERFDAALAKVEAHERAIAHRAPEAESEEETIRSFEERADRIVQRLRVLERRPGSVRPTGPTPAASPGRARDRLPAASARGRGETRPA